MTVLILHFLMACRCRTQSSSYIWLKAVVVSIICCWLLVPCWVAKMKSSAVCLALLARAAASDNITVASTCTGSNDPPAAPVCYEGSAGALGLKEDVKVKIDAYASGKGTMDLTGTGIEAISCKGKSFSKSGQEITPDITDCLPKVITVQKVDYCSDQDTIAVTVKDTKIPIPVTATLSKVACTVE